MLKKIVQFSVIGALLIALIGGTVYILSHPQDTEAGWTNEQGSEQNRQAAAEATSRGNGTRANGGTGGGNRGTTGANNAADEALASNGHGGGLGQGNESIGQGKDTVPGGQGHNSNPQAQEEAIGIEEWEQVQGIVTVADSELTLETADGTEILVGLGQASYREQTGFVINVGDEVVIDGFNEYGEFKAGVIENLTTGERLDVRDETGRPMWAGWRGRGNQ